jgi:type VI protein secretion system component VasF
MFDRKDVDAARDEIDRRIAASKQQVQSSEQYRGWKRLTPLARVLIVIVVAAVLAFLIGHALDLAGVQGTLEVPRGE